MLKLFIIFICCGLYQYTFAQEIDTSFIQNKKANHQINSQFQSTAEVADYFLLKYSTETARINGIYSWVTRNIRYDKTGTFALNAGPDKRAKIDVAFAQRRGVCENFSAIFNDICHKAGFESFIIEGITRINNRVQDGAHAWVTVKVNNEWTFFDPTWDAGGGSAYFMVSPEEFIGTHLPFDPLWQFLKYPEYAEMKKGERSKEPFYYKDSLTAWMQMDSIGKLESAVRRILNTSTKNRNVKSNLSVVKMNLEIERQGEQVEWHDMATTDLNEAVGMINQFIGYRNDLSLLQKSDAELNKLLRNARLMIERALTYLDKIDSSKASLVLGTWPERERIVLLKENLSSQDRFLTKYLSTALADRKELFYR